MNHDLYEGIDKKCENCALWDTMYQTHIPTRRAGWLGPEVTKACLCRASMDGPEVESDALLAEVHTGLAWAFTESEASCFSWKPDELTVQEIQQDEEEYERSLAWHRERGQYPGINCPPL